MDPNIHDLLANRFEQLPPIVRETITSGNTEAHLQKLAQVHRLHLDQWQTLENEVMLTLFGVEPIENLQTNIEKQVGIPADAARTITSDIMTEIFAPIRADLERKLDHPAAELKAQTGVEALREEELQRARSADAAPVTPSEPPPQPPATPPAPTPEVKITRPSESTSYRPGEISSARVSVHDDPYREPPL